MKMTRLMRLCAVVGALSGGATPGAHAADLHVAVTEAGDEYKLRVVAVLDAPGVYVYQVITDYRHAYRVDPAITSVEVLPMERDGVTRVKHRSEHHVGLFSFEIEWVGDIVETGQGRIEITTVPELSSFESGSAVWEIRPDGDHTWVLHESTLKPKFYVFPVIGDHLLKKQVEDETRDIFRRIERYARTLLESNIPEDLEDLSVVMSSNARQ